MKQNEEAQADQEDQEDQKKWRKWRNSERSDRSERSLGKIEHSVKRMFYRYPLHRWHASIRL